MCGTIRKTVKVITFFVIRYRPFHETIPRSSAFVNWNSVRFYETGCIQNWCLNCNWLQLVLTSVVFFENSSWFQLKEMALATLPDTFSSCFITRARQAVWFVYCSCGIRRPQDYCKCSVVCLLLLP